MLKKKDNPPGLFFFWCARHANELWGLSRAQKRVGRAFMNVSRAQKHVGRAFMDVSRAQKHVGRAFIGVGQAQKRMGQAQNPRSRAFTL